MSAYINTEDSRPPENKLLDTLDSGLNKNFLIRKGNLYWFSDMSMYVYYVPTQWRLAKGQS